MPVKPSGHMPKMSPAAIAFIWIHRVGKEPLKSAFVQCICFGRHCQTAKDETLSTTVKLPETCPGL